MGSVVHTLNHGRRRVALLISVLLSAPLGCTLTLDGGAEQGDLKDSFEPGLTLPSNGWRLSFEENFANFDVDDYNTEYIWPRDVLINNEDQFYIDEDAHNLSPFEVNSGVLSIVAQRTPDSLKWATSQPYVSGVLTSRFKGLSQQYGRFEMRARLPKGKGLWPAFWLLPTHDSWPDDSPMLPEIDIMEYIGDEGSDYHTTRHSNQSGSSEQESKVVETNADLNAEFHTYALEWNRLTISWLFDDQVVFEVDTPRDMHHPMHFLINLAVGGDWAGSPDDKTQFPARFEIDHVRVFQRVGENESEEASSELQLPKDLKGEALGASSVRLSWQAGGNHPEDTSYDVFRDDDYQTSVRELTFIDTAVSSGEHAYEISAHAAGYESSGRVRATVRVE